MAALIRSARPEDAPFLAWCILVAGRAHLRRGWYDIALGLGEAGCLEALTRLVLTEAPSWWRYDRWLVAEIDGAPAAGLAAFGANAFVASETALSQALSGLGWGPAQIGEVWRRGAYVFSCTMSPEDHEVWVIENVAVRPERRGQGLVGQLIARALELGRAEGFADAQISFVIGNAPAERAYARAGFGPIEERRHPDFEAAAGSPGLKRFGRAL
ncbi:MAG TPA: GNAT family N-acetyltransferase [Caulobacteraceae bacterium]